MHRIGLVYLLVGAAFAFAQGQNALSPLAAAASVPADVQQLRIWVEKINASKQPDTLKAHLHAVHEKIKQLKAQEPSNPQLTDLIELRILVSPIVELVKKGIPASVENCEQTQHEIQFMESFSEQEGRENHDGEEAQMLLKLFCPSITIQSK